MTIGARPHGAFYDHVIGALRRGEALKITPESVREVMHVIEMIRKGKLVDDLPRGEFDRERILKAALGNPPEVSS